MVGDKYWDQYWSNWHNRLERRSGGSALYRIDRLRPNIYTLGGVSSLASIFAAGSVQRSLLGGLCTLLISVLQEKWFVSKSDKYEGSDDDHCHHRSSQRSQRCQRRSSGNTVQPGTWERSHSATGSGWRRLADPPKSSHGLVSRPVDPNGPGAGPLRGMP